MLNFPQDRKYKIVFVDDKAGFIASDHEKQILYISKDLKLNVTDDGKLRATFPNFRPKLNGGFGCSSSYRPETDCSVIISDPSVFNYCVQEKNGEYTLSGSKVTFNGTTKNDRLVLDECIASTIDLGEGDDTVTIGTNSRPIYFAKNKIKTGTGDDTVKVFGNFKRFTQNEFYLGKGSDKFNAEINPDDDVLTHSEFERNYHQYGSCVSKNEIYAIDGYTGDGDTKGWFEKNVFTAKTYSANQFFKHISGGDNELDGFQLFNFKPEPKQEFKSLCKNPVVVPPKEETQAKPETIYDVRDRIQQKQSTGLILSQYPMLDSEAAKKGLEDYENSFQEWVDAMRKDVNK